MQISNKQIGHHSNNSASNVNFNGRFIRGKYWSDDCYSIYSHSINRPFERYSDFLRSYTNKAEPKQLLREKFKIKNLFLYLKSEIIHRRFVRHLEKNSHQEFPRDFIDNDFSEVFKLST